MKIKPKLVALLPMLPGVVFANDVKLSCGVRGQALDLVVKNDLKISVVSAGYVPTSILENSPGVMKKGKITILESMEIEGEPAIASQSEKEIVRISEASGKYVLVLFKKAISLKEEPNRFGYLGYLLNGGQGPIIDGDTQRAKNLNNSVVCYGKSDALELP